MRSLLENLLELDRTTKKNGFIEMAEPRAARHHAARKRLSATDEHGSHGYGKPTQKLYPCPSVKIRGQTAFPNHNRYDETNDQHRQDPRPRTPRLPWQPHARSRSPHFRWPLRSRDGAFRPFHRLEGGAQTAFRHG